MNIFITGASSGIGYQTALQFARTGAHRIVVVARNEEKLLQLKKDCEFQGAGATVYPIVINLRSPNLTIIKETMRSIVGGLDVVINNAGFLVNKPFAAITAEELRESYEVNVQAPFLLTQMLLPFLRKGNNPQIVNIGSMGGVNATAKFKGLSAYSSSKGALSILSECLAEELKEEGIRVNCLALGSVNTEMLKRAFPGYEANHEAADMAEFIVNFIEQTSSFFNGKTIQVSSTTP